MNLISLNKSMKNKKVAVIGAGKSGLSACKLLKKLEAIVFLSEKNKNYNIKELEKNLVILGGVFVIEALSVMTQVGYFHLSKILYGESRRFFLMAPIHHHFELKGWKETQVVIRFWIIGIIFAILTFSTFKIR